MIPFALEGTVPLPVVPQYEVLPAMDTPLRVQFQTVSAYPPYCSKPEAALQSIPHEYVDWAIAEGTVDNAMTSRRIGTENGRSIFRHCIGFHHEKAGHISF